MWKLKFQISGLPGDDGERRQERDDIDSPRKPTAIWLVAGFVLAYLLGAGAQSGNGVAIVSPINGSSTFDAQAVVSGTITGIHGDLVTLRVNDTTQTAPVNNGAFQSPVNLDVGRNDIRASSGDLESELITITRKARPMLTIDSPPPVSTQPEAEVEVLGTAENLQGESIRLEVNGVAQDLPTPGGRFSTKVPLVVGSNTIRAVAPGSDPASVIVMRTEVNQPAIAITSPASFSTDADSVLVTGTVVNSDVAEATLYRNNSPTRVPIAAGQFQYRMSLDMERNEIQASLGDVAPAVVSNVVIVIRKPPARIVIATVPPVSNLSLMSQSLVSRVLIDGTLENLDAKNVWLSLDNTTPRALLPVRDGKFEFSLALKAGDNYRIQASLGDVVSNEIIINVPPARNTEPTGPGSTVTSEECARINCDCEHLGLTPPGFAQSRLLAQSRLPDRIPTKAEMSLRTQCLATQQQLRAKCEETHQRPGPCPAETSGPKAWPSSLTKKGVKQP